MNEILQRTLKQDVKKVIDEFYYLNKYYDEMVFIAKSMEQLKILTTENLKMNKMIIDIIKNDVLKLDEYINYMVDYFSNDIRFENSREYLDIYECVMIFTLEYIYNYKDKERE